MVSGGPASDTNTSSPSPVQASPPSIGHHDVGKRSDRSPDLSPTAASRLPVELIEQILHLSTVTTSIDPSSHQSSRSVWRYTSQPLRNPSRIAQLCLLSWALNEAFTNELYTSVVLLHDDAINAFKRTISEKVRLGLYVQHLAILNNAGFASTALPLVERQGWREQRQVQPGDQQAADRAGTTQNSAPTSSGPPADRILVHCPNVTHLMLSRSYFFDWSPGLYRMTAAREATLVDVVRNSDLDGLVSRHRASVTQALQNNPRIQALLNPSGLSTGSNESPGTDGSDSSLLFPLSIARSSPRPLNASLPLTHLHLVNFDGRLIHHLIQITSLTHIVLTNPLLPERAPGAPGLSVIPRSHLVLLLGSGRIRKIIIRAEAANCLRIMEEIMPIEDQKLVFRAIKPRHGREDTAAEPSSSSDGRSSQGSFDVREVDLLGEWWERIHLDSQRRRTRNRSTTLGTNSSSSREHDSFDSSEMEGDSSFSDERGRSSSGSGSYDSSNQSFEQRPGSDAMQESVISEARPAASTSFVGSVIPAPAPEAPPPQVPIEMLLQFEDLERARQIRDSVHAVVAAGGPQLPPPTSSRRRLQRAAGVYSARRVDIRGANQAGTDQLSELMDHESRNTVNFW